MLRCFCTGGSARFHNERLHGGLLFGRPQRSWVSDSDDQCEVRQVQDDRQGDVQADLCWLLVDSKKSMDGDVFLADKWDG